MVLLLRSLWRLAGASETADAAMALSTFSASQTLFVAVSVAVISRVVAVASKVVTYLGWWQWYLRCLTFLYGSEGKGLLLLLRAIQLLLSKG